MTRYEVAKEVLTEEGLSLDEIEDNLEQARRNVPAFGEWLKAEAPANARTMLKLAMVLYSMAPDQIKKYNKERLDKLRANQ